MSKEKHELDPSYEIDYTSMVCDDDTGIYSIIFTMKDGATYTYVTKDKTRADKYYLNPPTRIIMQLVNNGGRPVMYDGNMFIKKPHSCDMCDYESDNGYIEDEEGNGAQATTNAVAANQAQSDQLAQNKPAQTSFTQWADFTRVFNASGVFYKD